MKRQGDLGGNPGLGTQLNLMLDLYLSVLVDLLKNACPLYSEEPKAILHFCGVEGYL